MGHPADTARPAARPAVWRAAGRGRSGPAPADSGRAAGRDGYRGVRRSAGPVLAAEPGGVYAADTPPLPSTDRRVAAVTAAVAELAGTDLDGLSDAGLERLLAGLRTPIGQLAALRSRAATLSQSRRLAAAPQAPTGGTIRDHQRRLADLQNQTPSEIKRDVEAGKAARDHQATGQAFQAGQLSPEHARMIGRILTDLPDDRRGPVEDELLALAGRLDAVAFGRAARRIQARETPEALARDQRRQHHRRWFRAADTPEGGLSLSGTLYGDAAETARVALDAFRRPDTPDEHREPEQRSADAFEQLCTAALRAGRAPTDHGIRPHVMIVLDAEQYHAALAGQTGTATLAHSGQPVTTDRIGHLLADADLTRIILDADRTPIEVSTTSRHVPHGLWKALVVRDQGCTWAGCTAPTSWCDVAHGNTPFRRDGKLSPRNAALLCRRHHRIFDTGPYTIHIDGDTVTYQRHPKPPDDEDGGEDGGGGDGGHDDGGGDGDGRRPDPDRDPPPTGPAQDPGPDAPPLPGLEPGPGRRPDREPDPVLDPRGDPGG